MPTTTTSKISGTYLNHLAPGLPATRGLIDLIIIMKPKEANARIMVVLFTCSMWSITNINFSSGLWGGSVLASGWDMMAARPSIGTSCSIKMIWWRQPVVFRSKTMWTGYLTIPTAVMKPRSNGRESTTSRKPSRSSPSALVMRPI